MQSRMEQPSEQSLWGMLEGITENLKHKRLADVFRFVSFRPFETFGPHKHLRIEINYVKKGNCILHLENERSSCRKSSPASIRTGTGRRRIWRLSRSFPKKTG